MSIDARDYLGMKHPGNTKVAKITPQDITTEKYTQRNWPVKVFRRLLLFFF